MLLHSTGGVEGERFLNPDIGLVGAGKRRDGDNVPFAVVEVLRVEGVGQDRLRPRGDVMQGVGACGADLDCRVRQPSERIRGVNLCTRALELQGIDCRRAVDR